MKSENFFKTRLSRLKNQVKHWGVEACLIEDPIDLFYLTGLRLSKGLLIATAKKAELFVDGRYLQLAKEKGSVKVERYDEKKLAEATLKSIAFDSAKSNYDHFLKLKDLFSASLKPVPHLLRDLRLIKDPHELKAMKESAALIWKGFEHISSIIETGIAEKEVALELELFCLRCGAQRMAFESIIAFGPNSAMPHYRAGNAKLKKGDIIQIDIGAVLNGYCSDMSRVLFWGSVPPKLKKIYSLVREAQRAALRHCRPGVAVGKLDEAARAVIKKGGYEKQFVHPLGHGVGLEVHESPRILFDGADKDLILQPGMAITIEPGIYLPDVGGARYEDTVIIHSKGCHNLYPDTP